MQFSFSFSLISLDFKLPKCPRWTIRRHSPMPWPRRAINILEIQFENKLSNNIFFHVVLIFMQAQFESYFDPKLPKLVAETGHKETFTNVMKKAGHKNVKDLVGFFCFFFSNHTFIFMQFQFSCNFSLTFISILTNNMAKANYKETLTNAMSKNGHKNIKMFVLVIASAGFQSAIENFTIQLWLSTITHCIQMTFSH